MQSLQCTNPVVVFQEKSGGSCAKFAKIFIRSGMFAEYLD